MSENAIVELINTTKDSFMAKQATQDISFDAEAGFAVQSLVGNSYSTKIAMQNRQSVIDAVTNVSAIGISLNPAKKQAYLVPREGKICLDISYMGLIDLAVATGSILWAQCMIVHANDSFELNGVDKQPTHGRDPFNTDRGAISGAYSCVKTPQGDFLTHAMPISEIYAIRDRSAAWKSGKSSPWKTDEGEMIKKTVIKQASKYWPKTSPQLENALHYLNTETNEQIEDINPSRKPHGADVEEKVVVDVEDHVKKLEEAAEKGVTPFRDMYLALDDDVKEAIGIEERNRINQLAVELEGKNDE